jgi:integrase
MTSILQGILEHRYADRDRESPFVFSASTGGMIDTTTIAQVMPRLCREAGVKPFGFHAIRHYIAGVLQDSGKMSLVAIQRQLRHKRPTTTDTYLNSMRTTGDTAAEVIEAASQKGVQPKVQPIEKKKAGSDIA